MPRRSLSESESSYASSVGRWKLQDAKSRFSEVVRAAQSDGPQHVTVHGKEAVVVLSAAEYSRLSALDDRPTLHALLSQSPLRDLEFGEEGVRSPIRDFTL